jgi:mevalonate kinase
MREQYFYGHGKLLLSGEYLVLDGAKALALPMKTGQTLNVRYKRSYNPKLHWKSYDHENKLWFEATFELWHFNSTDNDSEDAKVLQKILQQARKQNVHFLRDEVDVFVETKLEFNREWGLGSSSSLIYNIAQWAYISPYELLDKTFGGSGYDIACAQSMGPITYQVTKKGPQWSSVNFNPFYKDGIYFVYLNKKQNSRKAIKRYRDLNIENKKDLIKKINVITDKMVEAIDLHEFEQLMFEHENLMSAALDMPRIKESSFNDYWGGVKSLGAWGGDFVMVTSNRSEAETKEYFMKNGYETILKFDDSVCQNFSMLNLAHQNLEYSTLDKNDEFEM